MLKRVSVPRRGPLVLVVLIALLTAFSPTVAAHAERHSSLVGPKKYYLALGDSLAFGYQPDGDYAHGYAEDFFASLREDGTHVLANMGCPGETSATMIQGNCPYPTLRKYPYAGAQLDAAVAFLQQHRGQVSPVTLDMGANDLLHDVDPRTCAISPNYLSDLTQLDANLTQVILPRLHAALTVHGRARGDLVMMNYYDPFQNLCPQDVVFTQLLNRHLAADVQGFGTIVDVFGAFGGESVPNSNLCSYTWICSSFHDIHATDLGYSVIADTFEDSTY